MDDHAYAELKTYLRRLGWSLSAVPERDRDDIVEETRVHVLARLDQGQSLRDVLNALGPAPAYGRRFIDEMELSRALGSQRPWHMLGAVAKRAHRNLAALLGLMGVLALTAWAAGWCVSAALKPFDPNRVGVWSGPHTFFVGALAQPKPALHELVGPWIYPLALINVVVAWFLARLLLLWSVRTLSRRD